MNKQTNTCLFCGGTVLRHIRNGELYWFCLSCRQETPLLTISRLSKRLENSNPSLVNSQVTKNSVDY